MSCPTLTLISDEECIGDSLATINSNFVALSTSLCTLELSGGGGSSTLDTTPVGSVMYFAASSAPAGWFECAGQILDRDTYIDLWSVIGYTFGGSGNTFRLPNLRGEFVRGWDNTRGIDSGRVFGSSQIGTAIIFDANYSAFNTSSVILRTDKTGGTSNTNWTDPNNACGDIGGDLVQNALAIYPNLLNSFISRTSPVPIELNTQGFGTVMARPRNVALLPCIKYAQVQGVTTVGLSAQQVLTSINNLANGPSVAKAWVNFDGTGASASLRSSYNVSGVTKNGTGDYTITFSTPMPNANYTALYSTGYGVTFADRYRYIFTAANADPTTAAIRVGTRSNTGALSDNLYNFIVVFS